jgi:hypothetical protein
MLQKSSRMHTITSSRRQCSNDDTISSPTAETTLRRGPNVFVPRSLCSFGSSYQRFVLGLQDLCTRFVRNNCNYFLYCVLLAGTQGPSAAVPFLPSRARGAIALGTAAAAAAKAAAGGLCQPGGRAGPGTLSLDVPHHTPAGHRRPSRVGDQRQDRERIKAFLHRDLGCRRGIPAAGGTIV